MTHSSISISPVGTSLGTSAPLHPFLQNAQAFATTGDALAELAPEGPLVVWRPHILAQNARMLVNTFPGICHFAVKSNPAPYALCGLWDAGVRAFDVASIGEVRLVSTHCPGARMAFMHPVKSPRAIAEAYTDHGVRAFVLDHMDELAKIMQHTNHAADLTLVVRLAVTNSHAAWPLSGKFGAPAAEVVSLLQAVHHLGCKTGLSFHVGSQCLSPAAYTEALEQAAAVVNAAGVPLSVINVGGGFPVPMQSDEPPAFTHYADAIQTALKAHPAFQNAELWSEPGRAMVAPAGSLVARVELRKNDVLYLNDGVYGGLFESGPAMGLCYPVRVWRDGKPLPAGTHPFSMFGPTCDSIDKIPGPFHLPADMAAGDHIEFFGLGAYGEATRTAFNGFTETTFAIVNS